MVNRLVSHGRGMFPWRTSGSPRSVDHEAHEEHEGIGQRSVRYHLLLAARDASEPRSNNRSCDSAARRSPSSWPSCPSWLLQLSPVVNAMGGERPRPPGGQASLSSSKPSYSPSLVNRLVSHRRGMFPWRTSGSPRSVDHEEHETHEEHEGIGQRSVRYHLLLPARRASEPRSNNRSCDSATRRIPSS